MPDDLLKVFANDFQVDIHITTSSVSAEEVAFQAVRDGCVYLIAAGGDGTIHEVVNGVMRCPAESRGHVAVGALPLGSGNDFVRSIGMTGGIRELRAMIRDEAVRAIDLGLAVVTEPDGGEKRVYFDNIASLGIGSAIVEKVNRRPSWLSASAAFHGAILSTLVTWRPQRMRVRVDGGEWIDGAFQAVCIANGRFFGSGLGVAPDARLDDGRFEVVLIRDAGARDFVRFLPQLKKSQRIASPKIEYLSGGLVEVAGVGGAPSIEADGEHLGRGAVRFSVVPAALRCLVRQT